MPALHFCDFLSLEQKLKFIKHGFWKKCLAGNQAQAVEERCKQPLPLQSGYLLFVALGRSLDLSAPQLLHLEDRTIHFKHPWFCGSQKGHRLSFARAFGFNSCFGISRTLSFFSQWLQLHHSCLGNCSPLLTTPATTCPVILVWQPLRALHPPDRKDEPAVNTWPSQGQPQAVSDFPNSSWQGYFSFPFGTLVTRMEPWSYLSSSPLVSQRAAEQEARPEVEAKMREVQEETDSWWHSWHLIQMTLRPAPWSPSCDLVMAVHHNHIFA